MLVHQVIMWFSLLCAILIGLSLWRDLPVWGRAIWWLMVYSFLNDIAVLSLISLSVNEGDFWFSICGYLNTMWAVIAPVVVIYALCETTTNNPVASRMLPRVIGLCSFAVQMAKPFFPALTQLFYLIDLTMVVTITLAVVIAMRINPYPNEHENRFYHAILAYSLPLIPFFALGVYTGTLKYFWWYNTTAYTVSYLLYARLFWLSRSPQIRLAIS